MTASGARVSVRSGPGWALRALRDALTLLGRERSLWVWCALPALVNAAAFGLGLFLFFRYGFDPIAETLSLWLAVDDPGRWYGWLWVAPLRALAWLARGALFIAALVLCYLAFVLLGGVLASPFLEVLSRRVEALRAGSVSETAEAGVLATLAAAGRSMLEEGRRVLYFAALQAILLGVGLVPGLQPVAAAGAVVATAVFLPLDYAGYLLDRRGVRFRARRRWVWRHRGAMLGFGFASLGTFALPLVNFVCLPWLVAAATLLALDLGPPSADAESLPKGGVERG